MPDISHFDPLAEFVALETERRELEVRLKKVKEQAAALGETLLDDWADRGQQNAKVNGLTVYIAQEFHCWKGKGVTTEQMCLALRRNEIDIVAPAYNASSLKSFVRERIEEDGVVPPDLDQLLDYGTEPKLRTRSA